MHTQHNARFFIFIFIVYFAIIHPFTLVLLSLVKYIEPGIFIMCSEKEKDLLLRDK